jgi:glutamate synthase domain-containing protein 3
VPEFDPKPRAAGPASRTPAIIDCTGKTTREINELVREAMARGDTEVTLLEPSARHNLAVALPESVRVSIEGSAGYYVAGLNDGASVLVRGSAGISMKGGLLIVAGNAGGMAGFMMQKGAIIICGNAGDGVADCMYAGTVFLGGDHRDLGSDAVFAELTDDDKQMLGLTLSHWKITPPDREFRKLVAGRRLWNFQKSDRELWKSAL